MQCELRGVSWRGVQGLYYCVLVLLLCRAARLCRTALSWSFPSEEETPLGVLPSKCLVTCKSDMSVHLFPRMTSRFILLLLFLPNFCLCSASLVHPTLLRVDHEGVLLCCGSDRHREDLHSPWHSTHTRLSIRDFLSPHHLRLRAAASHMGRDCTTGRVCMLSPKYTETIEIFSVLFKFF
mgnify:CR=1 FL=1